MNISDAAILGISGSALVTLVVAQFKGAGWFAGNGTLAAIVAGWLVALLYLVYSTFGAGKWPTISDGVGAIVLGLLLGAGGSGIKSHLDKQNEKTATKAVHSGLGGAQAANDQGTVQPGAGA